MSGSENLKKLLNNMWLDYIKMTPLAKKVVDLLSKEGEKVVNDHIALRTFQHEKLGIDNLAHAFILNGYIECGEYEFIEKKLFAKHFKHPSGKYPLVFISELKVSLLSKKAQKIIHRLIDQVTEVHTSDINFSFSGRPWNISFDDYDFLRQESEYAGWLAAIGFRPNHFTVLINNLTKYNDILKLNEFLKANSITLNSSGGEVKGTKVDLLEQSSTLADSIRVTFSDKEEIVPSCYYEFAKRYPMKNGELFQGFVAKSADKIFESTDKAQD